jgi:hypothetical protein
MYRERLLLTQQRLLRSGFFTLRGMGSSSSRVRGSEAGPGREETFEVPACLRLRLTFFLCGSCKLIEIGIFIFAVP